jgi:hypothetical protein
MSTRWTFRRSGVKSGAQAGPCCPKQEDSHCLITEISISSCLIRLPPSVLCGPRSSSSRHRASPRCAWTGKEITSVSQLGLRTVIKQVAYFRFSSASRSIPVSPEIRQIVQSGSSNIPDPETLGLVSMQTNIYRPGSLP